MSDGIPTGKTYLLFTLKWIAIGAVAFTFCVAMLMTGHHATAAILFLSCVFFFVRECRELGKRATRGIRRTYDIERTLPELRVDAKQLTDEKRQDG